MLEAPKADHKEANNTVSQLMMIYCVLVILFKVFVIQLHTDMHHLPCRYNHE